MSNPPFHSSAEDAMPKVPCARLAIFKGGKQKNPMLNFSGIEKELIYEGGEMRFIQTLIRESQNYSKNVFWFTTLVSKQSHLKGLYATRENSSSCRRSRQFRNGHGQQIDSNFGVDVFN